MSEDEDLNLREDLSKQMAPKRRAAWAQAKPVRQVKKPPTPTPSASVEEEGGESERSEDSEFAEDEDGCDEEEAFMRKMKKQ